jgi:hypothetical protein
MKYATVEDIIASFPRPVLPIVQGELDYQTIHAIQKSLQANSREIDTHLGGRTLGHLVILVPYASYDIMSPAANAGTTIWKSPTAPGQDPGNTDGTAAQISTARHIRAASIKKEYHHCF